VWAVKVLVIQNCATEGVGWYEQFLVDQGATVDTVHAYRGDSFPGVASHDACIVGGTPVAAYAIDEHSYLKEEWNFLEAAVDAGMPCLGICFRGQLLARVLGADVRPNPTKEIGAYTVRRVVPDPVIAGLPAAFPVFQWHGDTFDVPDGATLLVEGDLCRNQLFRHGNAVAVQFHVEVTSEEAARWADEYSEELAQFGKTKKQIVAECAMHEAEMRPLARRLLNNVLQLA
jgi:GMP synthase-like glutamine amidotransferase